MSSMGSISLGLATKDSASTSPGRFEEVLSSVKREVPVEEVLLSDAGSDDTPRAVEKAFRNVVRVKSGNRAVARQSIIDSCRTEWLLFVDVDGVLKRGWLSAARGAGDAKAGQVWGVVDARGARARPGATLLDFRRRGGCQDTLVRMEALRGVEIPPFLHWYEDLYIKRHVESGGWKSRVSAVGCVHRMTPAEAYRKELTKYCREFHRCSRYMRQYTPRPRSAVASVLSELTDPRAKGLGRRLLLESAVKRLRYDFNLYR